MPAAIPPRTVSVVVMSEGFPRAVRPLRYVRGAVPLLQLDRVYPCPVGASLFRFPSVRPRYCLTLPHLMRLLLLGVVPAYALCVGATVLVQRSSCSAGGVPALSSPAAYPGRLPVPLLSPQLPHHSAVCTLL